MYPHLHPSGSPSPSFIYSGYEQCCSKDGWITAVSDSWLTFYSLPPRSSSLPQTAINPKVTIHPPQPVLVSDIDTPSSISSHTILTPSSPFALHDVGQVEFEPMDFDEFDCDDEDDFLDSDYTDEMEGIDEADQGPSPLYGASAPHVVKSTSALEGALGDTPPYSTHLGAAPTDRRLSASVPGYPSSSRSSAAMHQRWSDSPATTSYPSSHTHASSATSPPALSLYNHILISTSSSLAGAFASSGPSPHASRPTSYPLPILQPQPIRPIPPIPLADLTASANDSSSPESSQTHHPPKRLRPLSPLPLLYQPVSDAVRYQFREPPASGALNDACCDEENASEPMCEYVVSASEKDQFAQQGLAFKERLHSCGRIDLPIRWQ